MTDVLKPIVIGTVVNGRKLSLCAIDKEISESLDGVYEGNSSADNREFVVSIQQSKAKDVFSGWLVNRRHLLETLPLHTELWNLTGKVDYATMKCQGTIQRFSSNGNLLGRMVFKAVYQNKHLVLDIIGLKGQILLEKKDITVVKPSFIMEGQNDN